MENFSNLFTPLTENGLFRSHLDMENIPLDTSFVFPEEGVSELPPFPDIIQPLLPPQVNYDKVSQAASKFKNDTLFLRKFYFNPTLNNILLLILLVFLTLWIIVSNAVTIAVLWRSRRRGHVAEIYFANLAVSDVLLGILILPLMSVVILVGYFPFSPFLCDVWVFLDYYLIVASSFGNTALMCNYFWMIRCPGTFPVDSRQHIVALAVTWMAVNLCWTPPFFNDRLSVIYPTGHCGFSISKNQYFSFYIGVTGFYLPVLISLICGIWSAAILRRKSGLSIYFWRTGANNHTNSEDDLRSRKTGWKSSLVNVESHKVLGRKYKKGRPLTVRHLSNMVRSSFSNSVSEADEIFRVAAEHFPMVAAYLVQSLFCRGMFFVYFGVGSFVHNFFPPDLSNGVYWLMHSEAALSPIVHFCFDSELRHGIMRILGLRTPRNSPLVQPIVTRTNHQDTNYPSSSTSSPPSKDQRTPLASISIREQKPQRSLQHFMSFDHDNGHHHHHHRPHQLDGVHRSSEGGLHL